MWKKMFQGWQNFGSQSMRFSNILADIQQLLELWFQREVELRKGRELSWSQNSKTQYGQYKEVWSRDEKILR
jgi:hypothetical protein